jgi:hypothetical protein
MSMGLGASGFLLNVCAPTVTMMSAPVAAGALLNIISVSIGIKGYFSKGRNFFRRRRRPPIFIFIW